MENKRQPFPDTTTIWITFILFTKLIAWLNSTVFFGGAASSSSRVISYPLGKKVLNPNIKLLWPLNNSFTLTMTPEVSVLQKDSTLNNNNNNNNVEYIINDEDDDK